MEEIKHPVIVVDGVEVKAGNPKAKVWREMNEFSFTNSDDIVIDMAGLIAQTFNKPEITQEVVLENVDLAGITALYKECCGYVLAIFTNAMENLSKNV